MLKKHVFGPFNLNNSEIFRLSFEDIFLGNTRHLYEENEPTLGSSGGGLHGNICWLIAYYDCVFECKHWQCYIPYTCKSPYNVKFFYYDNQ